MRALGFSIAVAAIAIAIGGAASALPSPPPTPAVGTFAPLGTAAPIYSAAPPQPDAPPATAGSPKPLNHDRLSGAMTAFQWLAGRWACRTSLGAGGGDGTPARLWATVDSKRDVLDQTFATTLPSGATYRSDDVLAYDARKRAYVRRMVDSHGATVLLVAPAPYAPSMAFTGIVGTPQGKFYHLRATVAADPSNATFATTTAYWNPATKTWTVQSTGACSKISE